MVDIFFGIITQSAIRRGAFQSVTELRAAIEHRRLERALAPVQNLVANQIREVAGIPPSSGPEPLTCSTPVT